MQYQNNESAWIPLSEFNAEHILTELYKLSEDFLPVEVSRVYSEDNPYRKPGIRLIL